MRYLIVFFSLLISSVSLQAQAVPNLTTPASQRLNAAQQRQVLVESSLVSQLPFKNIGPSVQSGRVSDVAVDPDDPTHFYVAYA